MTEQLTDDALRAAVKAWVDAGGRKSRAAAALGVPRTTLIGWLREAENRLGIVLGKMADGHVHEVEYERMPLPAEGEVARYVLTSVQNNTHLHPAWLNLKAYADHLGAKFLVGTFTYDKDRFGPKSVKRGRTKKEDFESLWYAPEAEPFFTDKKIELAPALMWCGYINIIPTARRPLSGLETHNGRKSNIFPHVKMAMESVPSMPGEGTKFNFTTGTITQRNYIQKKTGQLAEEQHSYGGMLVEVDSKGAWWVRPLIIDANGHIYDVGPSGSPPVRVVEGVVLEDAKVEAIVWADAHEAEMEDWVRKLAWGRGGMLNTLRPRVQIVHDILSMRSRGHHDMKDPHVLFGKFARKEDRVEGEVESCARWLGESHREWCSTVVVPSNHDRHLERWLKEEDPRKGDLPNWRYHTELQLAYLRALEGQANTFNVLEHALRAKGIPEGVRFLAEDESYVLCRDIDGGIECGLHGDRGVSGARGSTQSLTRLGRSVIKGHDHTATVRDRVYSVGACSLRFPYMRGPGAHSITHAVVFENAKVQLITMWDGKWRA